MFIYQLKDCTEFIAETTVSSTIFCTRNQLWDVDIVSAIKVLKLKILYETK